MRDRTRRGGPLIIPTIDYRKGAVRIIDQTLLPAEERMLELRDPNSLAEAITTLRVRGAPAIGLAAAYGILVALERHLARAVARPPEYFFDRRRGISRFDAAGVSGDRLTRDLERARAVIAATRPTAVSLFWALERMSRAWKNSGDAGEISRNVAREAFAIHEEELATEIAIGRNGSRFIRDRMSVLTHCNAGGLATAGYGTALGVLYRACEEGKRLRVFADETRPLLQGARLTAWELARHGITATVLCEGAAASLFTAGRVDAVIVGADRIAANGDTANKVGTLALAILCERFRRPFYVAAPWSTFDLRIRSGRSIPIEERSPAEVAVIAGRRIVPAGTEVWNPAFDVTPARLIAAIITEHGVVRRPDAARVRVLAARVRRSTAGLRA